MDVWTSCANFDLSPRRAPATAAGGMGLDLAVRSIRGRHLTSVTHTSSRRCHRSRGARNRNGGGASCFWAVRIKSRVQY